MVSNPSSEQIMTQYLMSLAAIGRNQEQVPILNLEAQFDLNEAWEKLDKEFIDPDTYSLPLFIK